MTIRTPEEYVESLRDGREVYLEGEKVEDVTCYPHLRCSTETGAMDYILCQDPRYKNLIIEHDEKGKPYHHAFKPICSTVDLLRRRDIIQLTARTCYGTTGAAKFTGIDALHSITAVSRRMDKQLGTDYTTRVEASTGWESYRAWYRNYRLHQALWYKSPREYAKIARKSSLLVA